MVLARPSRQGKVVQDCLVPGGESVPAESVAQAEQARRVVMHVPVEVINSVKRAENSLGRNSR